MGKGREELMLRGGVDEARGKGEGGVDVARGKGEGVVDVVRGKVAFKASPAWDLIGLDLNHIYLPPPHSSQITFTTPPPCSSQIIF